MHALWSRWTAVTACLALVAHAQVMCPGTGWTAPSIYVGKCYKLLPNSYTWQDAENACATTAGGHLASITTQSEGQVVMDQYCGTLSAKAYWIGYRINPGSSAWTDRSQWGWSNGAPTTFLHSSAGATWLGTGEPDDAGCGIGHAGDDGSSPGKIGDYVCTSSYTNACCEIPSLPTPSVTRTQTASATASVTRTMTATGSKTASLSASVTLTGSSTQTGTATRTMTSTGSSSVTSTGSLSSSSTQTPSSSVSATRSATSSVTVSPSCSVTASSSLTSTASSSESATASSTATPSATQSGSESGTATSSSSVSPSANVTTSVTPTTSSSTTRSPATLIVGDLNADGTGLNGTALFAGAESGAVPIGVVAGAGAGGLIALLALLCCLWWFLCLVPRKRKAQEEAKARAKRAVHLQRAARLDGGKSTSTMAATLGLQKVTPADPIGGSSAPDGTTAGVRSQKQGGGSKAHAANMAGMFNAMNPALLRAKRGSLAPTGGAAGAAPGAAVRAPRMTMALAAYKKPVAAFKPTAAGATASQRRQSIALLASDAHGQAVDDGAFAVADGASSDEYNPYAAGESSYDYAGATPGDGYDDDPDSAAASGGDSELPTDDATGPAEHDHADPDADGDAEAEDDDYMDEDEAVEGAAARGVAGRAVKGGGYLRSKQKKVAEAAAAPLPPEPKKLVIGKGALITEKVETQVVKLRRVSKIRGDKTTTEMRQAAVGRFARPSAAPTAAFNPTAVGASSRNMLGSGGGRESAAAMTPYAFVATVSRLQVKAETARAAVAARNGGLRAAEEARAALAAEPYADDASAANPHVGYEATTGGASHNSGTTF